jgi:hypothetical protein
VGGCRQARGGDGRWLPAVQEEGRRVRSRPLVAHVVVHSTLTSRSVGWRSVKSKEIDLIKVCAVINGGVLCKTAL